MSGERRGAAALGLLLCEAGARAQVLERGLGAQSLRQQERAVRSPLPKTLWSEGGDPSSLAEQRWGLIVPEGDEGQRLVERIEPLIRQRRQQQGGAEVKIFRAPAKADQAGAMAWRKRHFDPGTDTREELPRYQLILGNLDQVALSIQQVQGIDGYVGRLAFDDPEHYRAYAEKVLRYENRPPPPGPGRAVFFTVHDGTEATTAGYDSLVRPGVALAQRKVLERRLAAREISDAGDAMIPSREELLALAAAPEPSVLFTLSHGAGAPRSGWKSAADQRLRQGAMSFGADGLLLGQDLAARPFVPGGVWFMLACYGAGTPERSAYHAWLERLSLTGEFSASAAAVLQGLPRPGERPFIAALPQAVLQNPEGPLAFMGHIDLAWTYSFTELDSGSAVDRPARFIQLLADVLRGHRAGIAFRSLMLALGATQTELATLYDQEEASAGEGTDPRLEARRGHLWMLRQDLSAYIVLGDPAVRLPLSGSPAPAAPPMDLPPPPEVRTSPAPPPPPVPQEPLSLDSLERAIARVLLEPAKLEELAGELRIGASELQEACAGYRQAGRAVLKKLR